MTTRRLWLFVLVFGAPALGAQDAPRDTASTHDTSLWLSATLGHATAEGRGLLGSQLALWYVRDRFAVTLRAADAGDLDVTDVGDLGILFGTRVKSPNTDWPLAMAIGAIGPTFVTESSTNRTHDTELGVGAIVEASFNFRYFGFGESAFGATSGQHRFAGFGVTLQLGRIQ